MNGSTQFLFVNCSLATFETDKSHENILGCFLTYVSQRHHQKLRSFVSERKIQKYSQSCRRRKLGVFVAVLQGFETKVSLSFLWAMFSSEGFQELKCP